jgi:hypothetical protein
MKVLIPLLLTMLALVGCAGSGGGSRAHQAASTTTTSPAPSAMPTTSADPSATPPPPLVTEAERPVIVVRSPNGMVAAMTADGTSRWAFDPHTIGLSDPILLTGGPNLLAIGDGRVVVIDRTGAVIGRGTYSGESPMGAVPTMHPSPTGTRWAWMTVSTVPAPGASTAGPHASSLWVAGLGEPPHRVRTWTGDFDVASRQWTDPGIVVVKSDYRCGELPQSSALVDPATGAESALFGANRWPLDVRAGLRVAMDTDHKSLYVAGTTQMTRTYPLPIQAAGIGPSGSRLFVSSLDMSGCGGTAQAATSVVDVPSAQETTIAGFFAEAWLDDTHLLGRSPVQGPPQGVTWSAHVQVSDLSGHRSDVALGTLVGVLNG